MKKAFLFIPMLTLVLMATGCGQQTPTANQQQSQNQVEGKTLMTIQEAKKVADVKAKTWATDAVVEKNFQSMIDETGRSDAWYFYYCSPSQNKVEYLTVKKEMVVSMTDQGECSYDQQGGEALKMDSPAVYNAAKKEIEAFKASNPDAVVIISLLRYNGLDFHYLWEVQAFPNQTDMEPTVTILLDDDGKVIDVTNYPQ
ncbi:MAG: hypothetical protein ACOZBH_01140 [Patescibacteria group bacterium]